MKNCMTKYMFIGCLKCYFSRFMKKNINQNLNYRLCKFQCITLTCYGRKLYK